MGSPANELPASRGVQILPLTQESASNQTSCREQALGLAWRWLALLRVVIALLWPWARNTPHLDTVVGAVVDVKALWRGDLLHLARPFSQRDAAIVAPGACRGVPFNWPLTD